VQETFVRVLGKRRVIASDLDELPYLMRALRNTHISWLRTKRRRAQTIPLEDAEFKLAADSSTSPSAMTEAREVFALISSLPKEFRDVVVAVDVVGLSYSEAAGALEVPEGTIMSRLYRGRARIAKAVEG
jgi:RNA polymerase sigma-70 factor (ECF subfamily)